MSRSAPSVAGLIGDTPVVFLTHLAEDLPGRVALKLESLNPGGSVKDRIGLSMIEDAERSGRLERGSLIVEPTSGNTGIALALLGAAWGYRVRLTMPESMSLERRKLLAAYGAELVLTPAALGMRGAVAEAERLVEQTGAFMPGQFTNPANPWVHYETTGPEILEALAEERIGAMVSAVGTGGTVSGAGLRLKEHDPSVLVIAVEPEESPVITQTREGREIQPGPHVIQGIGAGFIPGTLDMSVLDEVQTVTGPEAIAMARRLALEEGVMAGISSGANIVVALRVAARPEMAGKTVVTFACSTGERYLSTMLWEGVG